MGKTKVKYTNHKDRKKIGTVVEVDAGRAKQLIRDGLAIKADDQPVKKSEPAKVDAAKPKGEAK